MKLSEKASIFKFKEIFLISARVDRFLSVKFSIDINTLKLSNFSFLEFIIFFNSTKNLSTSFLSCFHHIVTPLGKSFTFFK